MKKMMMILVVLCGVLALGGCGKKAAVPLMDASWEQIIEEGLGLSEKKFWGTFPADNRESWTKKEGEETGKIGSKSSLPYVQYEIPDGGTIAGEESGMTLRFYQDSGLGAVSWSGRCTRRSADFIRRLRARSETRTTRVGRSGQTQAVLERRWRK